MLVQALAKDLIKRGGIRAVEAFGTSALPPEDCLVPTDFLPSVGFRTHRAHPHTPRMRMDLRSVLTWRSELEAALDRLLAAGAATGARRRGRSPTRRALPPTTWRLTQPMKSASSLRIADLGRAPTICLTSSPLWKTAMFGMPVTR